MKKFWGGYKHIAGFLAFLCVAVVMFSAESRAACRYLSSGDFVCDGQSGVPQAPAKKTANKKPIYNGDGNTYIPPFPSSVGSNHHMDMNNLGTQILMPTSANTISSSFTTTNNPEFFGKMAFGAQVQTEEITRQAWISSTPGGSALPHRACSVQGTLSTIINFAQTDNGPDWRCPLSLNTQYYLNVKVVNCPVGQSCPTHRIIYNNK